MIILTILIIFNIFLIWCIAQLLKRLLYISDNIDELLEMLDEYSSHIDKIYNMQTFYGDQTLKKLLEHSRAVVKEIKSHRNMYAIVDSEEELEREMDLEEEDIIDD